MSRSASNGEWAFARTGAATPTLLYDVTVGWAFVAAGLVASRRQPDSGSGLLMVCEGLAWFLTNLQGSGQQPLVLIGVLFGVVNEAVLAHLVLTFPTGRTSSRPELALVLIIYAISVSGGVAYLDTAGPSYDPYRCQGCTTGVSLFGGNLPLRGIAQRAVDGSGSIAGLAVIGVILSRWVKSTAAQQRLYAPLWLSLGTCVLITGTHVMEVFPVDLTGTASQAYVWVSDILQLAMPFAFLGVALRLRMTQVAVGDLVLKLGSDLSLEDLQAALARALGDPSFEMGLWHKASGEYRDSAGRTIALPDAGDRRILNRIDWAGGPVAICFHSCNHLRSSYCRPRSRVAGSLWTEMQSLESPCVRLQTPWPMVARSVHGRVRAHPDSVSGTARNVSGAATDRRCARTHDRMTVGIRRPRVPPPMAGGPPAGPAEAPQLDLVGRRRTRSSRTSVGSC